MDIRKILAKQPVVYITRDVERALGLPPTPGYFIITNATSFAKKMAKNRPDITLVKSPKILDTRELLSHSQTAAFMKKHPRASVLVFKNTLAIEAICASHNWTLLNPPATLANRVEEKISQLKWLGSLQKYLPPHQVVLGKKLIWKKTPYIIQFNRAHTGGGTTLIKSPKQIEELKSKFPNREMRVTDFVDGPAFTLIACVWRRRILTSSINYQITGLSPFTNNPFATIGNDWTLAHRLVGSRQRRQIQKIAIDIGKKLAKDGWKGLFGIDVMVEAKTGRVFLIEINARQQAGAVFESQLQQLTTDYPPDFATAKPLRAGRLRTTAVTTFEAHLAALLGGLLSTPYFLLPIKDGAQVIQRETKRIKNEELRMKIKRLKDLKLNVIEYDNTKPGSDLLRIQSTAGIMKNHNEFNEIGKKIISAL